MAVLIPDRHGFWSYKFNTYHTETQHSVPVHIVLRRSKIKIKSLR